MEETINNLQNEIRSIDAKLQELETLIPNESNPEVLDLIELEKNDLNEQKRVLEESLIALDPSNYGATEDGEKDIDGTIINTNTAILEIRSGTGGDEAGIFAADLYNMYLGYMEKHKLKYNEIFLSKNEIGGIKTISTEIRGLNIYNILKNESGVHRVQRIPVTETGGRIHTSTATVAVLPILKKIDIEIKPEELKWDFFRAGGHGGQNVNKVSTAVRLTHLPTNLVVECQEERTQGKNRDKALDMLKSKLYTMMTEQRVKKITDLRSNQVGSGERNEKIRTYNYPQNRITDHRVNQSWYGIDAIMAGAIDDILEITQNITAQQEAPEEQDQQ